MLLVHGLGAQSAGFARLVRLLRRHARTLTLVDLPGHGGSDRMRRGSLDVASLMSGVRESFAAVLSGREPATIIGNSLGGAVALRYALERPAHVRSLVLLSPGGAPISNHDMASLRQRFDVRTRSDARRFIAELMHKPPVYTRLIETSLARRLGQPNVRDFFDSLGDDAFFSPEQLRSLAVPTTLVWGGADRILPRTMRDFYRAHLPPSTVFIEPPTLGHSPHLENPALVARLVVDAHRRGAAAVLVRPTVEGG